MISWSNHSFIHSFFSVTTLSLSEQGVACIACVASITVLDDSTACVQFGAIKANTNIYVHKGIVERVWVFFVS